jgi:hypothetical protein
MGIEKIAVSRAETSAVDSQNQHHLVELTGLFAPILQREERHFDSHSVGGAFACRRKFFLRPN